MLEAADRPRSRMGTRASTRDATTVYATETLPARAEDAKSDRAREEDGHELRVLVLTNMYPSATEPSSRLFRQGPGRGSSLAGRRHDSNCLRRIDLESADTSR